MRSRQWKVVSDKLQRSFWLSGVEIMHTRLEISEVEEYPIHHQADPAEYSTHGEPAPTPRASVLRLIDSNGVLSGDLIGFLSLIFIHVNVQKHYTRHPCTCELGI